MGIDRYTTPREILFGVLWIWILATLVLTAALVVVGGAFVLESVTVRVVVGTLLLATVGRLIYLHRHHGDIERDPRLRWDRERRGF